MEVEEAEEAEEAEVAVVAEEGVATIIMAGEMMTGTSSVSMGKQSTSTLPINLKMNNGSTYLRKPGNNLSSCVENIGTEKDLEITKLIVETTQGYLRTTPGRFPSHTPITARSRGPFINCHLHLRVVLQCLQLDTQKSHRQQDIVTAKMTSVQYQVTRGGMQHMAPSWVAAMSKLT